MILPLLLLSSITYQDIHVLQEKVNTYQESLAPHPVYFSPLGAPKAERITIQDKEYIVMWDGKDLSIHPLDGYWPDGERDERIEPMDNGERREPLIIKIKKLCYLIYFKGEIRIKHILEGGEKIWDGLFNIPPPTEPPSDNGDSHGDNWSRN